MAFERHSAAHRFCRRDRFSAWLNEGLSKTHYGGVFTDPQGLDPTVSHLKSGTAKRKRTVARIYGIPGTPTIGNPTESLVHPIAKAPNAAGTLGACYVSERETAPSVIGLGRRRITREGP